MTHLFILEETYKFLISEWRMAAAKIGFDSFIGTALPTLYGSGISATEKIAEWIVEILYDEKCDFN